MLLMRDAMTVEEVKEFSLVPGWSGDVELECCVVA